MESIAVMVCLLLFGAVLLLLRNAAGRRRAAAHYIRPGIPRDDGTRLQLQPVRNVRITPLVDMFAASPEFLTEPGVAYLIEVDGTTILFDLGYNQRRAATPPVLANLHRLQRKSDQVDLIVISHPHLDHVCGIRNALTRRLDALGAEPWPFAGRPVFATVPLVAAGEAVTVVDGPQLISSMIGTTGALPVQLLMGYTLEQALVFHIAGKGLLLVIGCGHPGVQAFVERAEQVFGQPVFGVAGGLHFPVTGDRGPIGPVSPQRLLGTARPFSHPLTKADVEGALTYLRSKGVEFMSLSAHDSCDWSLAAFRQAFGPRYHPLLVGQALTIPAESE